MIVRQFRPAKRGRTAAPAARLHGETSEARLFVFVDFRTGTTERSEMTHARFARPDRNAPHAGTKPGAQRETCIHRIGGYVRPSAANAALDAIGKSSNQRGRTGM
ncbi:hypothetical protein [Longimicrobium sp.]|uniref:hypothetical protein n=1 Tax=Longimicrobium sp. TaxID=2029185 RepID=UPI002C57CF49|nr:hypothetical protein [Longimicrobium sp.]HSU16816.1 hypothetical protein [Longimicrobium sp.]